MALQAGAVGRKPAAALACLLATLSLRSALAQVFKNEPEALRSAFPEADQITPQDVLLDDAAAERLEKLARAKVRDRLVTFYTATKAGKVVGYAVIHSHVVRTKRETFTIAFEPDGRIRQIEVIAFFEPAEYKPTEKWLDQFKGKGSGDRLAVGDDIGAISGATLSARGIAEHSRWLLQALKDASARGAVKANAR